MAHHFHTQRLYHPMGSVQISNWWNLILRHQMFQTYDAYVLNWLHSTWTMVDQLSNWIHIRWWWLPNPERFEWLESSHYLICPSIGNDCWTATKIQMYSPGIFRLPSPIFSSLLDLQMTEQLWIIVNTCQIYATDLIR